MINLCVQNTNLNIQLKNVSQICYFILQVYFENYLANGWLLIKRDGNYYFFDYNTKIIQMFDFVSY